MIFGARGAKTIDVPRALEARGTSLVSSYAEPNYVIQEHTFSFLALRSFEVCSRN
jgi:hypothetical protein